jgi:Cellulase (glycosyl hydrolase family 5)
MLRNKLPLPTAAAVICSVALGALAGAPAALASHGEAVYFEGSTDLLSAATRPHAIAQLQTLGVKALRVELSWYDVAPGQKSATKPSFEPTNPGAYAWGEYDALINEAERLHWKVLLTITSPVPRWATSNKQAPYVTSPNAQDFEQFMTAVARHYGPNVLYSIWNEPNHPAFLRPQFNAKGQPTSPRIYRGLYQAAYAGLQAGGISHPQVLMGETAPFGYDTISRSMFRREGATHAVLHDVAPLAFLRGMLCLNARYQKSGSCSELQTAGYAHHAYTLPAGPYYKPHEPDDVTIGVLSRLTNALSLAARAHAIPGGVPIYLTEFGVQSLPNRELGVSLAKQAQFDALDEHIAWSNPRVAAFSQYLLKDDPVSSGKAGASVNGGFIGFQTGLENVHGAPKPLYSSWPVPLTVTKQGHRYALWGLIRPANGPTRATILVKRRGARKYTTLKTVTTESLGYWSFSSAVQGTAWRVRWISPAGVKYEGAPIAAYG